MNLLKYVGVSECLSGSVCGFATTEFTQQSIVGDIKDASAVVKVAGKDGLAGEDEDGAGWTKIPLGLVMCHAHDQVPLKLNG